MLRLYICFFRYGAELAQDMRQGTIRLKEQLNRTAPRDTPVKHRGRMEGTMPAVNETIGSEEEDLLNAIDDMAQTRVEVVNQLREQTNIKQSMLELEDQVKLGTTSSRAPCIKKSIFTEQKESHRDQQVAG